MTKRYAVAMLFFIGLLVPTIVFSADPTPYGQVIGRVSDVTEFTVLVNRVNGTHTVHWNGMILSGRAQFSWKWDNFTTPEGNLVAVGTVDVYDGFQYGVERPPSMHGFFFDNWTTRYDTVNGYWRYIGAIDIVVWYESSYTLTVDFEYMGDSWSETVDVNQSVRDTLTVGSLLEIDSSRPRIDYRTYPLIPWALGWIGIIGIVVSMRRES